LVQPVGIEPTSTVLHTAAMTTSAKVALFGAPVRNRTDFPCLQDRTSSIKGFKGNKLEHRVGLEPTTGRICNPLHWPLCHRCIKFGTQNVNRTRNFRLSGECYSHLTTRAIYCSVKFSSDKMYNSTPFC